MLFTLMPMAAFADGTSNADVVYGSYTGDTWTQDQTSGTKEYPIDNSGNTLTLSKTATPVAGADNKYNVTLQVVTTTTTTANSAATVLVIDVSGSMKYCADCGGSGSHTGSCDYKGSVRTSQTRLAAAKTAAKDFINSYRDTTNGSERYVAVVAFSDGIEKNSSWYDVSTAVGYKALVGEGGNLPSDSIIGGLSAGGGTNLDYALQTANGKFADNTVKDISAKNVIVLTDGIPTYYGSSKTYAHGDYGCPENNAATAISAETLRAAAKVYTVCFGVANQRCWTAGSEHSGHYFSIFWVTDETHDSDGPTVGEFLSGSIATSETGKTYAYNADNTTQLNTAFANIAKNITSGLSTGTVTDGLPTGVSFVGSKPTEFTASGSGYTWTLGTVTPTTDNGKKVYTYTCTYTVEIDPNVYTDDNYHPLNTNTYFTDADGHNYPFNVPGVKVKPQTFTVTYNKGANGTLAGQDSAGNVVHPNCEKGSTTPAAPDVEPADGYYFTGWDKEIASTVTADVTYTAQYAAKIPVTFTGESASNEYTGSEQELTGIEVTGLLTGHTYSGLTYSAKGTNVGEYPGSFTEENFKIFDADGTDVTGHYSVTKTPGKLTITKATSEVTVTITGNHASKTYNGSIQSVSGYTTDVGTKAISVALKDGKEAKASGKDVDTYNMGLTATDFTVTSENYSNIKVVVVDGYLEITPITDEVVVTITGNTKTEVYNGSEQSVSDYTWTVTGADKNQISVALKDGKEAVAKGTNVDKYMMGLTKDDFDVTSQNYGNIVVEYTDGWLEITRKSVIVTGESDTKVYNGYEQELTGITVSGLSDGHSYSELSYSAKGTDVGEYDGAFTGALKIVDKEGVDVTANYSIEYLPGKLTITPITDEVVVTIKGHTDTEYYNGKIQEVNGYDVVDISNALYSASYVSLEELGSDHAEGKDVGTYYMGLNSGSFVNNNQNFANVKFVVEDGWLKITNQPVDPGIYTKIIVKITGNSASEVYDGTEKSVEGYTVEISDPRYTEKDFKFTGTAEAKGTFVGEYPMGLEADQFVNINRRFKNVEFIIVEDGVLTITARPITITAGSAEGWVTDCPITCDEWTSTPPAPGDTVVSVKITGVQNGPGSSPNVPSDAVIKNEAGKDVTGNYDITYVNGLLVAKDLLEKEDHFNYVIGYPDGSVQPNGNITRAEVATIFYRLLTDEARAKYTTTDNSFSDVKAGEWYTKAIATLENANIIGGYPDGTFKPNAPITRAEMATIIAKFANLDENGKSFNDIKGHWAQSYVELAAGNGWINGYEDGTFRPDKNITRAETFAMINRVLDRQVESVDDLLPTSQMNMWSDNLDPTQWYYKDVQEATNYHKCDRVNESKYETWTEKVPDIDWAKIQY